MGNIEKWYMRLMLALVSVCPCIKLIAGYFSNIFFNAKGFIFLPFESFQYVLNYIDREFFWDILGVLILFMFIGPLIWPKKFIWPTVLINLFIVVGSADLLWRNYERAILFWTDLETGYGKYGWIKEQFFFLFLSALVVGLLLPSAVYLMRKTAWYNRVITIWK